MTLPQPRSHSARVAGPATQPLCQSGSSHSARVAGRATQPLSHSAKKWLSGWVAEWLTLAERLSGWVAGVKISAIARSIRNQVATYRTILLCFAIWLGEWNIIAGFLVYLLFVCLRPKRLPPGMRGLDSTHRDRHMIMQGPLERISPGSPPDLLTKTILRENLQVNVAPQIDPETATHTSCEPAQPKCIWTCHKSHLTREFTGKTRPRHTPQVFFRAFAIEMYMDMWDEELFCAWICKIL